MKKQKSFYRYFRYEGCMLHARREIPYEIKLSSRLILDELCFNWNKQKVESAINRSIDTNNKKEFMRLCKRHHRYLWE